MACPDPLTLLKCLQSISHLSTACPDPLPLLKCLTTFKMLYVFCISKLKHFKTHNHRPFNTSHTTLTRKKNTGDFLSCYHFVPVLCASLRKSFLKEAHNTGWFYSDFVMMMIPEGFLFKVMYIHVLINTENSYLLLHIV